MNVLIFSRYGRLGASSRLRSMQYLHALNAEGVDAVVSPLFSDAYVLGLQHGRRNFAEVLFSYFFRVKAMLTCRSYDLVWIEKEALPWMPYFVESMLLRGVNYALDYDDAIFHNYDLHRSSLVRRLLGRKLDLLMSGARLVVAGNSYLAQRARDADAPRVEIVPTVIDLERYKTLACPKSGGSVPRVVWIGSPSTGKYLKALEKSFQVLSTKYKFKLRVIGCVLDMKGVDVECVEWTESSEVASIAECDIGVMPLTDSPWERGKCGYKLIQYMAVSLPVVASPVGVNVEIVKDGVNGFVASSADEWVQKLGVLLEDAEMRQRMGAVGRLQVEREFCIQKVAPRLVDLIKSAATK